MTTSPIWTTCRCEQGHRNVARWLCCATGGFNVAGLPYVRRAGSAAVLCPQTRTAWLYFSCASAEANRYRPGSVCNGCLTTHHVVILAPQPKERHVPQPT
ncbi:hypothetical protein AB4Z55_20115 [Gordonia sp. ABKF26]|uniref:hypothetical protein n=1 Tax=Gordonia TaxID=2053 RepID=UPI00117C1EDE|nr:hypothetical protein [Gordonia terrae]UPW07832.1 hypothetical protein M1C59_17415 [Gordonia terrae]